MHLISGNTQSVFERVVVWSDDHWYGVGPRRRSGDWSRDALGRPDTQIDVLLLGLTAEARPSAWQVLLIRLCSVIAHVEDVSSLLVQVPVGNFLQVYGDPQDVGVAWG